MHFLEPLPSAVIFCCLQLFKFICDFFLVVCEEMRIHWLLLLLQLKALASLSVLLKQKSGKDIVPIIPQWVTFLFSLLHIDVGQCMQGV